MYPIESHFSSEPGIAILDMTADTDGYAFDRRICSEISKAEAELLSIDEKLAESVETLKKLTPACDKLDYILAAACGALCGIIDIFMVGKPGESSFGDVADSWFEERTKEFAKLCNWDDKKDDSLKAAIKHLEKRFKIPYDQVGAGDAASFVFDLNPGNHHFKSLGHNPTLLGLFFSIWDQFSNTSHFLSGGELISLQDADGKFELVGKNVPSKLFCAFVNWFGHLISDMSGSSSSKTRGMGIPSPIWSWANDIIVIKKQLGIPALEFEKAINEIALQIFKSGYDSRFQTAQMLPVFFNELVVRFIYSIRRVIRYFIKTQLEDRTFSLMWKECEPFSNATIRRMLTVAHGTFCLLDISDATIHGFSEGCGSFNVTQFILRLNVVGVGRFVISLYGEAKRSIQRISEKDSSILYKRKKAIVEEYIKGLYSLAEMYDNNELLALLRAFRQKNMYIQSFEVSGQLAVKRNGPKKKPFLSKEDIDRRFSGGKPNV